MNICVLPPKNGIIRAHITPPASKSLSNRALIIAAICQEKCALHNLSNADDTRHLINALQSKETNLYIGAGGTTLRFLTAYCAISNQTYTLSGTPRLHQRPIADLVNALRQLGADIEYVNNNNYPPLRIKGKKMRGGQVNINAHISSQFISALLLIAPTFDEGLTLHLNSAPVSKSYIDMTLKLMQFFGIQHTWNKNTIHIAPQKYKAQSYTVENDWSAASYFYAAAALAPQADIFLSGLQGYNHHNNPNNNKDNQTKPYPKHSLQGDSIIASIAAQHWNINTQYENKGIRIIKQTNNNTIPKQQNPQIDFKNCPDLAQTVAVVHAALNIPSIFSGLQTLQHKETNRINALNTELQKIAYSLLIEKLTDEQHITNPDKSLYAYLLPAKKMLTNTMPSFCTYDDHRMAMAFAPLSFIVPQGIIIQNCDVVTKSYPNFWHDWANLGFELSNPIT